MVRVFEEGRMSSVKYFHAAIRKTLKGRLCSLEGNHEVVFGPGNQYGTLDFRKNRIEILFRPAEALPCLFQYRSCFICGAHNPFSLLLCRLFDQDPLVVFVEGPLVPRGSSPSRSKETGQMHRQRYG
jgi:hypothetical protein